MALRIGDGGPRGGITEFCSASLGCFVNVIMPLTIRILIEHAI